MPTTTGPAERPTKLLTVVEMAAASARMRSLAMLWVVARNEAVKKAPNTEPIQLAAGYQVRVSFRAQLARGNYVFSWQTQVDDANGGATARFAQASFAQGALGAGGADDDPEAG